LTGQLGDELCICSYNDNSIQAWSKDNVTLLSFAVQETACKTFTYMADFPLLNDSASLFDGLLAVSLVISIDRSLGFIFKIAHNSYL
jgi:hypothetical protein